MNRGGAISERLACGQKKAAPEGAASHREETPRMGKDQSMLHCGIPQAQHGLSHGIIS